MSPDPATREQKENPLKRTLIVVAFHYLPDNTSTGVLRTLKFTDYLRRFGWHSEVISVPERLYVRTDPESVRRIPAGVHVHRPWAADVKHLFGIKGIYPDPLATPDRYWPWVLPAYRRALRVIRERNAEAIYTTYPPASAHLIGLWLKRRTGLPWIADFRDPWVEDSMPNWRRRVEGWLEGRILQSADRIICNTPAMRRWFLTRYPHLPGEKFEVITNGYDETDLAHVEAEIQEHFEILYPGMISAGNRNPLPLLDGINLARKRGLLPNEGVRLTLLGTGNYGRSQEFLEAMRNRELTEMTEVIADRVPYRDALRRMAGADVLVILSEPLGESPATEATRAWSHLQVPAKLYEYLRLGRPLLALVSGGAVAELLNSLDAGAPIRPDDPDAIAAFLGDTYRARGAHAPGRGTNPAIQAYSREHLSARLAGVLDELASEHTRALPEQ